ncbi:MAG TPA: hypothetical protein VFX24_02290 [Ktedonobacterales bacterium]|jgi:hypothetical protein|nr:hypothetical protein [Ktedonobacterales bacterium]
MPHATVTRPAARPTASASVSAAAPRETAIAAEEGPANHVSDFTIATAAAEAIRAAPGVVNISPGVPALVATYGAGKRVAGIVVRHLTPDQLALEAHVVLSEAYCHEMSAAAATDSARHGTEGGSVLGDIADRIREAAHGGLRDTISSPLARVDVYIDDLR